MPPTCFGHSCGHPQGGELQRIYPQEGAEQKTYLRIAILCTVKPYFIFLEPKTLLIFHTSIYVFCVDLRTNSDYLPIQH